MKQINSSKVKEYIIVKNQFNHPKLEEVRQYEWDGDLVYMDETCRMLNEVFHMNKLSTETSYVVALDHAKKLKGVCQIGHGSPNEVSVPMQNIFTFLMLVGANAFVVAHNHVSNMPESSIADNVITMKINTIAKLFDIEFIGHMIISPNGYVIDGGVMNGCNSFKEDDNSSAFEIEYLDNGKAATYIFGNRVEGNAEDIEKIVEDFQRVDMSRNRYIEGTGLGLNIARQLLLLMG